MLDQRAGRERPAAASDGIGVGLAGASSGRAAHRLRGSARLRAGRSSNALNTFGKLIHAPVKDSIASGIRTQKPVM